MRLKIPELAVVVLIGPSGSGKSTFARRHFLRTEVLSSDYCRGLVSDDENSQDATNDAFDVLHFIAAKRLKGARLTVVDATNVQPEARRPLVELARSFHCLPVAIVFDLPERVCQDRNRDRADRDFGSHVIRNQRAQMRRALRGFEREGFRYVYTFHSPEDVDAAELFRDPLYNNKKHEKGPFDIIGDVHGCYDELTELLEKLGYRIDHTAKTGPVVTPPESRKAVFLGDLVDRGPRIPQVLRLVMRMVADGIAFCIPGNHDIKLMRALRGKNVKVAHGLAESLEQLATEPPEFRAEVQKFIDSLVSHYVLDDGRLVIAHAGMKEEMQGRGSGAVREFALYGETTGETDEFGLPVRYNWAADYRGRAMVVYGHTPVPEPQWLNGTINIDTGCVFGGSLTALRYPEKKLLSVPARRQYAFPAKPITALIDIAAEVLAQADVLALSSDESAPLTLQQAHDDLLDVGDLLGKQFIETRFSRRVTVREGQAAAALEVMARFAVDPRWLIYLPPTMSPSETSSRDGFLEYPTEAFEYYRSHGVSKVVIEEKHMGSRAVLVVARDLDAARRRFGIVDGSTGVVVTRTGRPFFAHHAVQNEMVSLVANAFGAAGLWDELATDWFCLDAELMPWSAKAQELLRRQYAAVGAAAQPMLGRAVEVLGTTLERDDLESRQMMEDLLTRTQGRAQRADQFIEAYRRYCWPVHTLADHRLAPFHLLATESQVHIDKPHSWHMETLGRICDADAQNVLMRTEWNEIDLHDPESESAACGWWEELTARGGEGMVIKPYDFVAHDKRGLVQPALKCRGREYLRIIYGPDYDLPENLERLRARGVAAKRSLAAREFALGIEALERFTRGEPLRRVHECTFAVLALESEPVDPRL